MQNRRLTLLDQGSSNGTYVNGSKVSQVRLKRGDLVRVGGLQILVDVEGSESSPGPSVVSEGATERGGTRLEPGRSDRSTKPVREKKAELETRLAELEHLQSTRSQMAVWLVDDIENATKSLSGYLQRIKRQIVEEGLDSEQVELADSCSRQIYSMAMSVLEVQRMDEGARILRTRKINLNRIVLSCTQRIAHVAKRMRVKLYTPDAAKERFVIADHAVISRVLDNLLDNALRNAGRGGWVTVGTKLLTSTVRLEVTDSGLGVPETDRDRGFNQWHQARDREERYLGLGLYYCRIAAEAHGGSIAVENTRGRNQVVVELPSAAVSGTETLSNIESRE